MSDSLQFGSRAQSAHAGHEEYHVSGQESYNGRHCQHCLCDASNGGDPSLHAPAGSSEQACAIEFYMLKLPECPLTFPCLFPVITGWRHRHIDG